MKELETVINHFKMYPLMTRKCSDFKLIIMVNGIMRRKEHLTEDGLRKIVAIKASMNRGLSDKLKLAFPDVVEVERPRVELPKTIDPNWLAGFTSGEGCFIINIHKSSTHSLGQSVNLVFSIVQHMRDKGLLIRISEFLGCGTLYKQSENTVIIMISKFKDIVTTIIPFFLQYPIHGVKALDFKDFCLVAEMMKEKKHLIKEGLETIKKIKAGMNRGRKN